jgi:hypothetical protein
VWEFRFRGISTLSEDLWGFLVLKKRFGNKKNIV